MEDSWKSRNSQSKMRKHCVVLEGKVMLSVSVRWEHLGRNIPEMARNIPRIAVQEEPSGRNVSKMARNISRMAYWGEAILRMAKCLVMEEAMVMVIVMMPEELFPGLMKVETVPEELVRRNIPGMANRMG
jgi:hypothetical protein